MKKIFLVSIIVIAVIFFFRKESNLNKTFEVENGTLSENSNPIINKIFATHKQSVVNNKINPKVMTSSIDYIPATPQEENLMRSRFIFAKSLPSESDQLFIRNMMSNKDQIDWTLNLLKADNEKQFVVSGEIKRMDAVAFLDEAISWKSNPMNAYITESLIAYLKSYSSHANLPVRLQRSLAADHAEIFKSLRINNPKLASKVMRESMGLPVLNVMRFANNFYFKAGKK